MVYALVTLQSTRKYAGYEFQASGAVEQKARSARRLCVRRTFNDVYDHHSTGDNEWTTDVR